MQQDPGNSLEGRDWRSQLGGKDREKMAVSHSKGTGPSGWLAPQARPWAVWGSSCRPTFDWADGLQG